MQVKSLVRRRRHLMLSTRTQLSVHFRENEALVLQRSTASVSRFGLENIWLNVGPGCIQRESGPFVLHLGAIVKRAVIGANTGAAAPLLRR